MAQKGRKFRKYLKGKVEIDLSPGALASNTGAKANAGDVVTEKAYITSVVLKWALQSLAATDDMGPVLVGVAHSDYTATEIDEWIANLGSWEESDKVGQEIGRRLIREVGLFEMPADITEIAVLNDGKAIRTKCGWMLATGQTIAIWARNTGTTDLAGSPTIHASGHANLWPR